MKRDFSTESKNRLFGLIDDINREQLCGFTDWIGDLSYTVKSWTGSLNINHYFNDVAAYQKKVLDKDNASRKSIQKIFSDVARVDNSYSNSCSKIISSLKHWDRYIVQMSSIINPNNAGFECDFIRDSLEGVLNEFSTDHIYPNLSAYVQYDSVRNVYIYDWDAIRTLTDKGTDQLSDVDCELLAYLLSTFVDDETGMIDSENLQKFISLGYKQPSPVTGNDYHESFLNMVNGDKLRYQYIQNKSYLKDSYKGIFVLYNELCEQGKIVEKNRDLNNILFVVTENYPVIEWRERSINMKSDFWSGELYIGQDTLDQFNSACVPKIEIAYCEDSIDGTGLAYYRIRSNAFNHGDVRTTTPYSDVIRINDPKTDNYRDLTTRIFIGCENENANIEAISMEADVILNRDYKEYNLSEKVCNTIIETVIKKLPAGSGIMSALYKLSNSENPIEGMDAINSGVQSQEFGKTEKQKKAVENGLDINGELIGYVRDYYATLENNKKVDQRKNELSNTKSELCRLNNLGLRYKTMVVVYDHTEYQEFHTCDGTGIKVDGDKDCDKTKKCQISQRDFEFDSALLRNQYNTIMHKNSKENYISDEDYAVLENDIKRYITNKEYTSEMTGEYLRKLGYID